MFTRREANAALIGGIALATMGPTVGRANEVIQLPPAQTEGGKPLMEALKMRRTIRTFDTRPLPPQVLSNLLWAAGGINRPESSLRTAPSWRGWAHVDLYITMPDGVWLYDPKEHRLVLHVKEDLRAATTTEQPFVKVAPLNIVYVSDGDKMKEISDENSVIASVADASMIAQNVYIFCASEGLATVIRGLVPRLQLAKKMKLRPNQRIYLAQTVGYPQS